MTAYANGISFGGEAIESVYYGSALINRAYKGDTLLYDKDGIFGDFFIMDEFDGIVSSGSSFYLYDNKKEKD